MNGPNLVSWEGMLSPVYDLTDSVHSIVHSSYKVDFRQRIEHNLQLLQL
jgi:hypothetical protein